MADKLKTYRGKRRADKTPEPAGKKAAKGKGRNRFVIQEHSATALHWDLRLERDGVLVSWALPRGLPLDPKRNHMAVHTEDHPLEYLDFHGDIPKGNYGAGWMRVWDTGTYEVEGVGAAASSSWPSTASASTTSSRSFRPARTAKNWLIHRMDPPPEGWEPLPEGLEPMRPSEGKRIPESEDEWAYEIEWDGLRVLAYSEPGRLRLEHPERGDVTAQFPEVRRLNRQLSSNAAILDGVVAAFGRDGLPVAGAVERTAAKKSPRPRKSDPRFSLQLFDLLHFDGASLLDSAYEERRERLEGLELERRRLADARQPPRRGRGPARARRRARPARHRRQAARQHLPARAPSRRTGAGSERQADAGAGRLRVDAGPRTGKCGSRTTGAWSTTLAGAQAQRFLARATEGASDVGRAAADGPRHGQLQARQRAALSPSVPETVICDGVRDARRLDGQLDPAADRGAARSRWRSSAAARRREAGGGGAARGGACGRG